LRASKVRKEARQAKAATRSVEELGERMSKAAPMSWREWKRERMVVVSFVGFSPERTERADFSSWWGEVS